MEQYTPMKKKAFTLSEVLITLAIIGIVAVLTIPTIINKSKAKRLRSQFMKSYSTLQQVVMRMHEEDDNPDPALFYTEPNSYRELFMKYLAGATDCGQRTGALASGLSTPCYTAGIWNEYPNRPTYKSFTGEKSEGGLFAAGQILLQDGSLWLFYINNMWHETTITIDINGYKTPPDRLGYDLFTFEYVDGRFVPEGGKDTHYTDAEKYCSLTSSEQRNGEGCAIRAANEPDYFDWAVANLK
jgi:prepilin-type N-terminal cleavage/methylation domain-containing protein